MRRFSLLWSLCISTFISAQEITTGEYFFGNDPGLGNGTAISITAGSTVVKTLSLPVSSLDEGFHNLAVRFKDSDGHWSHYSQRHFYVLDVADVVPQITGGEYFFNDDPGIGNGTALSLTAGNQVNTMLALPEDGLPEGFNTISIRVKDGSGNWSHYAQRVFYLLAVPLVVPEISSAEYFFDNDPGVGNATNIALTSTGNTITQNLSIPLNGLDEGFHNLVIRMKNTNGNWGHYEQRVFYVMKDAIDAQSVVSAEYFIDTDPGVGSGAPLSINTTGGTIQQTFIVPTPGGLSDGMHFLYARVKNNLNKWSVTAVDTFNIDATLPVTGMELTGIMQQQKTLLTWYTLTETNTNYFEVERSSDGVNFNAIGSQPGAGNSTGKKEYHYTDATPVNGINYYRLKQVDKDGRFAYSNIIVINNNTGRQLLAIYPNPATNMIRLTLENTTEYWRVAIYDAGGKFVTTQKTNNGVLNISTLSKGSYFINVSDGVKQYYGKFIKK